MTNDSNPVQFELSHNSNVAPLRTDSGADAFEKSSKTTNRPDTEDGGAASELPTVVVTLQHEPADFASVFLETLGSDETNCDPDCAAILAAMMEVLDVFTVQEQDFSEGEEK